MKFKAKWFALVLMITMVFTACGKTAKDDTKNITKEPTVTEQPTVTVEPTQEVTDSEAKEITRIVSFSPSITELIYALEAGDLLVGRTDYCDYPAEALNVDSIGDFYNPDMEKVIELNPDVVIASSLWTDEIAKKFDEAGIDVLVLGDTTKLDDVYTVIETLGEELNRKEEATSLIQTMQSDLQEVTDKVKDLEVKTVYYVSGYGEYGDYTATGDTYIHEMLTLAGGDNIAKDATGWTYSLETLIEQDPEIIIIGAAMKDDFMSMDNYKNLSAVKNNQVYGIDNNLIDRQSNRMVEGVTAIAEILHPEAFTK